MTEVTTVRRRRLGAELRRLRETAGLTLEDAGNALDCSDSKISRIETGYRSIRLVDLRALLDAYRVADEPRREALARLARESKRRDWWESYSDVLASPYQDFIGLESRAAVISVYQSQVVPGLLQTEEYARAVITAMRVDDDPAEIDSKVSVKMSREAVLTREDAPRFNLVLDEAVLHRPIGSAAVMSAQLERLLAVSKAKNVLVQILPYRAGAHAALGGPFQIVSFPQLSEPTLVYLESLTGGLYVENQSDVALYELAFQHLQVEALPVTASRALIHAVARELS